MWTTSLSEGGTFPRNSKKPRYSTRVIGRKEISRVSGRKSILHSFCCDGEEDAIDCEFSSIFFFAGMVEEVPNAEEYLTQALASLP